MLEIEPVIVLALLSTTHSLHKLVSCTVSVIHPVTTIVDKDLSLFFSLMLLVLFFLGTNFQRPKRTIGCHYLSL